MRLIYRENVTSTRYAVNTRVRAFRTPYVREYAEVTFVVFRFRVTFSGRCRRLYQSSREFNAFTPNSFLHFTFSLIFFFFFSYHKVLLVVRAYIRDVYFYDLCQMYVHKIHTFLGVHVRAFVTTFIDRRQRETATLHSREHRFLDYLLRRSMVKESYLDMLYCRRRRCTEEFSR